MMAWLGWGSAVLVSVVVGWWFMTRRAAREVIAEQHPEPVEPGPRLFPPSVAHGPERRRYPRRKVIQVERIAPRGQRVPVKRLVDEPRRQDDDSLMPLTFVNPFVSVPTPMPDAADVLFGGGRSGGAGGGVTWDEPSTIEITHSAPAGDVGYDSGASSYSGGGNDSGGSVSDFSGGGGFDGGGSGGDCGGGGGGSD